MSTCISRHGEYGSHVPDEDYLCTRCAVLDEQGLIDERRALRTQLDEAHATIERQRAECADAAGQLAEAHADAADVASASPWAVWSRSSQYINMLVDSRDHAEDMLTSVQTERDEAQNCTVGTRQMANEANTRLRLLLLAALGLADDGRTSLTEYVTLLVDERDKARAELKRTEDLWMVAEESAKTDRLSPVTQTAETERGDLGATYLETRPNVMTQRRHGSPS